MKSSHMILAVGMLITGSFNSISNKLADRESAKGTTDESHEFNHPYVQSLAMFIGEFSCLLVFHFLICLARSRGKAEDEIEKAGPGFNKWVMAVPALCDSLATTLMNVGLTLTHVSVFQMLRGSVVIFTGLLSVLFLNSKLYAFHWTGMFLVLLGLGCVGLASVLNADEGDAGAKNPLLGDALVIAAQVIVSIQMVVEQKFVGAHNVPALLAVGLEGVFGCLIMITALVALYYIPGDSAGNHAENIIDAGYQMSQNPVILLAVLGNVFSIAFFNYFGISVTKEMDATTRMVLDSLRTFTIWAVSLLIGWETFQGVQVIGFAILLFGTCVYNKIVVFDFLMTEYNADRMSDDGMIQSNDAKRISMKESLLDNQMDSDDFAMSMPAPALMRTDSPMYTKDVNMHPGSGNV